MKILSALGPREHVVLKRTSALFMTLEFFAAIGLTIGLMVAGDELMRTTCRWCGTNAFDEGVRSLIVADDRLWAGSMTHKISIGLLPLLAILGTAVPALFSTRKRAAIQDFVLILATFLVTTGLTGPFKAFTSRERPGFVHHMVTEASQAPAGEQLASFFSGDTAWAFCFVAVGVTLAYLRGYRTYKPMAIIGGLGAVATALLRIRADMHWATDVMMGACVGTAIGAGVPYLLHRPAKAASAEVIGLAPPAEAEASAVARAA